MISILRGRQQKSKPLMQAFESLATAAMTPIEVQHILRKIPKHELPLVNLDGRLDPQDLLIQCMVVPPVCIRPSVMLSNQQSN